MTISNPGPLHLQALQIRYRDGLPPEQLLAQITTAIDAYGDPALFISLADADHLAVQLAKLEARRAAGDPLPLYGVPFAVKDNIDVAGLPTTAACPDFAYMPQRSATVVEKLCAAGAIVIGKTNLDQFATGLVGVRSPYGIPRNPFNSEYIPGGSSSGSAVAVSAGLVSFALGTDTAGSGRIPAGLNNLIGLKPSVGRVSTRGVVPACRTLDCVSIFSLTAPDAATVLRVAAGFDPADPFSKPASTWTHPHFPASFTFGVPRPEQLQFFSDSHMPALYARAIERLEDMGGKRIEIDFAPFTKTARLLYEGPWVAERYLAARSILEKRPGALLEVTRAIIAPGGRPLATEAFSAFYQLAALKRDISPTWEQIQCLVVPTAPAHYTIAQLKADPIRLNSNLGFYTNFVNLLDLCAVAVPAGFVAPNMPAGVTFIAPAGHEAALLDLASQFHQAAGGSLGATDTPLPPHVSLTKPPVGIPLAVLGAHLSGLPLNKQLLEMGATLVAKTRTSAQYRFYALPNTVPAKPGLIRDPRGGASIDLEVWHLDPAAFGKFVAAIPAPLGIGKIELEDGTWVSGFLCEPQGLVGAEEITHHGGWRNYLAPTLK